MSLSPKTSMPFFLKSAALAGKGSVVNFAGAAAGASLFQDGLFAAKYARQVQRLLRASLVLRGHISAGLHDDKVSLPLGWLARGGEASQLFGTDGHELIAPHERLDGQNGLASAVIAAGRAKKAGADQNRFHLSYPFSVQNGGSERIALVDEL